MRLRGSSFDHDLDRQTLFHFGRLFEANEDHDCDESDVADRGGRGSHGPSPMPFFLDSHQPIVGLMKLDARRPVGQDRAGQSDGRER